MDEYIELSKENLMNAGLTYDEARDVILGFPEWTLLRIGWEIDPGRVQGSVYYRVAGGLGPISRDRDSLDVLRDVVNRRGLPHPDQKWGVEVLARPVIELSKENLMDEYIELSKENLMDDLHESDGFTTPFIVDLQSGTWMDANTSAIIFLTSDQIDRFAEMADSERIEYANKHKGKITFGKK